MMSSFESVSWKEEVDPLNKPIELKFQYNVLQNSSYGSW